MKKVLKIIGIVILVIVVLVVILLIYLSNKPAVPNDYTSKVETGGEIEAKYLKNGSYEVSFYEGATLQGFSKYNIYYPSELSNSNKTYPVVVYANGSGTPSSKYSAVLKHMASWGFIAIGTEEEYDWNGFASEMCIRHLAKLNETETIDDEANFFYGKVDFENVGIVGHSQGGVGVFNATTAQEHSNVFKAAVALSPTNHELASNIEWAYDVTKIQAPIMLISGEGGGDDWVVTGEQLKSIYDDISSDKIMARLVATDHGYTLYYADGYVTAWFMWHLQGDEDASRAFVGDEAEIRNNSRYLDVDSSFRLD